MVDASATFSRLESDARDILGAAIAAVSPNRLVAAALDRGVVSRLDRFRRVILVSCGKAAVPMAAAFVNHAGDRIDAGIVTAPERSEPSDVLSRLEFMTSSHPVPESRSESAAARVMEIARSLTERDAMIVLLSGGGSALWSLPAEGLSLAHQQQTVDVLLRAGADIHEMNTVRKHISAIKGGWLAAAASQASVTTLIISDVVGDDPSTIASGPTVPDPTTFRDALGVLDSRGGRGAYPTPVVDYLVAGAGRQRPETPKPGARHFENNSVHVIGSNRDALDGAARRASTLGYVVHDNRKPVTGEASEVGRRMARHLRSVDSNQPACIIWGGETTVTVTGSGSGGRNQELALAAAVELAGAERPLVLLSAGTDGVDGPTDAAGAVVSPLTVPLASSLGVDASEHLSNNDAYAFFDRIGGHVKTGPTQTNVMDIQIALSPGDTRSQVG